ncbi:MAG: ParB/RepB/Spo0J family partition protein [Spirochaetaceae bacterium]|jgi:ParB family chromosome partitioning protein|nr:ParB/RepB/Spo0J family partition protein [Spirochaetaceae bacterium]
MQHKKFGLGKGLDALLPLDNIENPPSETAAGVAMLSLDKIIANPNQPRKTFPADALEELAKTIKKNGVLQPIIVEKGEDGNYIIIAGERRTRASRLAGLSEIPAIIGRFTPEESFIVALIENIQRSDLNPIEEAFAYKQLMEITGLNQDAAAAKVGKNRATFANILRLLKLPPDIQEALRAGDISAGHARAILSLNKGEEQETLFQKILAESLSVRESERFAGGGVNDNEIPPRNAKRTRGATENAEKTGSSSTPAKIRDADYEAIEQKFIEALGTKVVFDGDFSGGTIKIEYYSKEDLQRLYEIIIREG